MAELYMTGTVSVASGTTTVTLSGGLWSDVRAGDEIQIGDLPGRAIASLTDATHLELATPIGVDVVGSTYAIVFDSPQRFTSGYLAEQVRVMIAQAGIIKAAAPVYRVQGVPNAPPASPVAGDFYLVWTAPTGAWVGQSGNLAQWTGSAWQFTTTESGWIVYNIATGQQFIRGLSGWQVYTAPSSFMATVMDDADAATARGTLGVQAALGFTPLNAAGVSSFGATLIDDADAVAARTTLGAVSKAGDTLTGTLNVRPTANDVWSIGHGAPMTIADAGAIGWTTSSGYLMIADHNNGNHALFKVANTVVQRLDSGAGYSTTPGNSGTLNVYWNAGGFFYVLENRRGGPVSVMVVNIKVRSAG
ncbi:MAG: hypothetical protein K0Q69_1184 [Devosia sp.]|jgi:hypothetical protein|nr:hypothetical protein [Devosia sp.]